MHPIRKMFEDYVNLRNIAVTPDNFPTEADYKNHVMCIESEAEAVLWELEQNGYTARFTHLDDDGYHYELEQI